MTVDLEFDLSVLDDEQRQASQGEAGPLEQWANQAVYKPGGSVVLDIETGPLPWSEIEQYWTQPKVVEPFDPAFVKYGNLKDKDKRDAKLAEAEAAHKTLVENYETTVEMSMAQFLDRAALSPITGRVLAIGWIQPGVQVQPEIWGSNVVADVTEISILREWWKMVAGWIEQKTTIVGHNLLGFDLPFLIRRSWKHGIDVPRDIRQGRFWSPLIRDTMVEWQMGSGMVKLDDLARFFAVGHKTDGVSGDDFARLWTEDRELACEYLRNDVTMTQLVATAMGLI